MKKIIFIVLLIIICIGIYIFKNYNEPSKKAENETQDKRETEVAPILKSKKEVIEHLKEGGVIVRYIGEENGCWHFEGDNTFKYTYCLDDGILKANEESFPK